MAPPQRILKPLGRGLGDAVPEPVKRAIQQLEAHAQEVGASVHNLQTGNIWLARQVFAANGFYKPTPGTTLVLMRGVGGGGAGGGATGGAGVAAGAGGASGLYWEYRITGPIVGGAVTIGAAGVASGGTGGNTTVVINGTTYTFVGGTGGATMATSTTINVASPGQVTGAGAGQHGTPGLVANSGGMAGNGGSSPLGIGGPGRTGAAGAGGTAQGFGAGGGGALAAAATFSGGAATGGLVIIDEYR